MSYHYQIVNLLIDPVGVGAKKLRLHRVLVTPQGAELPNIVWPTLRKLKAPVTVQIISTGSSKPDLTSEAFSYKERSAKGTSYGVFFNEKLDETKLGKRLPWKNAESRAERRKLPRFSGFPDSLTPLSVRLSVTEQEPRDVIITNVSLNGLGIEFINKGIGSFGGGIIMGETVKLLVERSTAQGLRLVTQENAVDSPYIQLSCEIRRIVEIFEPDETVRFKIGLRIKHDDYLAEQSWKNWVGTIADQ